MSLFHELKRRNVFRVAAAYVIVGWLVMQVAETMAPALRLPDWFTSVVAAFLILGFPLALIFAWAFELTPEGLRKEKDVDRSQSITHVTGRKLDFAIIALLGVAVIYLAVDKFAGAPADEAAADTASASAPVSTASIAVLPFENMSDDASNEYFADGITEELLNLLAKIPELHVTSRSSAFAFKGQAVSIPEVAAQLKVAHILEGSVRKAGNTVRVTAQLIKADEDKHLWSESFDRELDDIFAIQDEIAGTVVEQLEVTLLGRVPVSRVTDTEAYDHYLEGLHFLDVDTPDAWAMAEDAFRKALDIDPDYAPAWYGLSRALWERANYGDIDLDDGARQSKAATRRALELDPDYAEAWAKLAFLQLAYDWNWDGAQRTIRKALDLGSNGAYVLFVASRVFASLGEMDKGVEYSERALAADPLSRVQVRLTALQRYSAGDLEGALRTFSEGARIHGDAGELASDTALILALLGRTDEALERHSRLPPGAVTDFSGIFVYTAAGDRAEAERRLQRVQEEMGDVLAYQYALIATFMGRHDDAFEWLEAAYARRDGGMVYLISDPLLAPLYDDPRWEPLLAKIGLLDYWNTMPRRPTPL